MRIGLGAVMGLAVLAQGCASAPPATRADADAQLVACPVTPNFFGSRQDAKVFDIPAGSAATTLALYEKQAGIDLIYPEQNVADLQTYPIKGFMDFRVALQCLLEKSSLVIVRDDGDVVTLVRSTPGSGPF